MTRIVAPIAAVSLLFAATPAFAQATRTWVSGVGDDANPCSRTAPCKTFAGAISKTAANGEINVLDPGGFGAVTITKSLVIDGLGPMSSILAVGTNGVIINGAGIVVTLRNLTINGAGTTIGNGIRIINAAAVNIDNVTIQNFAGTGTNGRGVTIETNVANVRVAIQNSRFFNLANFSIQSDPPGGNVSLDIDNITSTAGGNTAIQIRQNTVAAINRATITNHPGSAITLNNTGVVANISNSVLANNGFGLFNGVSGGAPTARLYGTVITGNTTEGIRIAGGQVVSYGNNAIRGNAAGEAVSSNAGTQ